MRGLTKGYVLRRFGLFFLTIWLGATAIFFIPRMMPGDPVWAMIELMMAQAGHIENAGEIIEAWRKKFGLDRPWYEQYLAYMRNTLSLDLNYSLAFFPSRVDELIARSLPWTI